MTQTHKFPLQGYTCPWPGCGKYFPVKPHLDRHKMSHTAERTYSCGLCDYSTNQKSNLDRHVAKKHYNNKGNNSPDQIFRPHQAVGNVANGGGWYPPLELSEVWLKSNENVTPVTLSPPRVLTFSPEKSMGSLPIAPLPPFSISSFLLSPVKTVHDQQLDLSWLEVDPQLGEIIKA